MPAAKTADGGGGESSTAAAKKAVSAASGGNPTYELPWYGVLLERISVWYFISMYDMGLADK